MYANALKTRPLRTNVATSGVITVASDTIAQFVDNQQKGSADLRLDYQRSLSMMCWGTLVSGGALFYWFKFLDRLFPPERNTVMRVLAKVGVNQVSCKIPPNALPKCVQTSATSCCQLAHFRARLMPDANLVAGWLSVPFEWRLLRRRYCAQPRLDASRRQKSVSLFSVEPAPICLSSLARHVLHAFITDTYRRRIILRPAGWRNGKERHATTSRAR